MAPAVFFWDAAGGPSLEGRSEALGWLLLLVLLAAMVAGVVSEVEEGGALALHGHMVDGVGTGMSAATLAMAGWAAPSLCP